MGLLVEKEGLGGGEMVIKEVVGFEDEVEVLGEVLEEFYDEGGWGFEGDRVIGRDEGVEEVVERFDGGVGERGGKWVRVVLDGEMDEGAGGFRC